MTEEEKELKWILIHSDSVLPVVGLIENDKDAMAYHFIHLKEAFILRPKKEPDFIKYLDNMLGCRNINPCDAFYDPFMYYNVDKASYISHVDSDAWGKFLVNYKIGMKRHNTIKEVKD